MEAILFSGGCTVQYLKNVVGSAKVFICPLQQKLSLERVLENKDLVSFIWLEVLRVQVLLCNVL